ncbi:hypothetical protein Ciccas_004494 [Cichlidogyrus casuarinus]|uniref:Uncharacterized protein n=1 Tax=Cichlidogyrus casuarinus TaxID=1844966 RepID=A0ABD2QBE5_9PLAT
MEKKSKKHLNSFVNMLVTFICDEKHPDLTTHAYRWLRALFDAFPTVHRQPELSKQFIRLTSHYAWKKNYKSQVLGLLSSFNEVEQKVLIKKPKRYNCDEYPSTGYDFNDDSETEFGDTDKLKEEVLLKNRRKLLELMGENDDFSSTLFPNEFSESDLESAQENSNSGDGSAPVSSTDDGVFDIGSEFEGSDEEMVSFYPYINNLIL